MLLSVLNDMSDPRRDQGKVYQMAPLLTIICLAILANAKEYMEIETFVQEKFKTLKPLLKLKWRRPPSYGTIRRICIWANPNNLEAIFRKYSFELNSQNNTNMKAIAIDGKVLRGSYDKSGKIKPIQLISAFLVEHQIILAHADIVNEKTNEIPKVQELIESLGVKGYVFTMDALHCQYKTLKAVTESKNNAIIQVKRNQKKLNNLCEKIAKGWDSIDTHVEDNGGRNRVEKRVAKVFKKNKYFINHIDIEWSEHIEIIIKIERTRSVFNTETQAWIDAYEESYYVGTNCFTAEESNNFIRNHWGIENRLHYVRDKSMGEDDNQSHTGVETLSKLRSFALNILRANFVKNVKNELYRNSLNVDRVMKYKFLLN